MLAMLGILFWITVVGANYPSEWLSNLFGFIKEKLYILFDFLHAPDVVTGLLIDGVYTTLSWGGICDAAAYGYILSVVFTC